MSRKRTDPAEALGERARKSVAVKRALAALQRQGRLTPEAVVEAARDRASPLHAYFDWDDHLAAEKWRLQQARTIIRCVVVKVTTTGGEAVTVPVYVRDPGAKDDEQGYIELARIQDDPAAARLALHYELHRVEGLLSRAESIAEVCGMRTDVQRVGRRVTSLRRRVQPAANA